MVFRGRARRQARRQQRRGVLQAISQGDVTSTAANQVFTVDQGAFTNVPTSWGIVVSGVSAEFIQDDVAAHSSVQLFTDQDCLQPAEGLSPARSTGLGFIARIRMRFRRALARIMHTASVLFKYIVSEIVDSMHFTFKLLFSMDPMGPLTVLPVPAVILQRTYLDQLMSLFPDPLALIEASRVSGKQLTEGNVRDGVQIVTSGESES